MTYDFLLLGVVRSGLLLAFALFLMWACRKRPAVQRVVGRSALVLGATLFWLQPQLDFARTYYTPYSSTYISARPVVTVAAPKFGEPLPSTYQPTERETVPSGASFELSPLHAWILGAGLVLAWTAIGTLRIRQIRRRAVAVPSVGGLTVVSECGVSTPFVAGLFRPTLFIPSDWDETTTPEEREFVLQHEKAHLKHRDLPWLYLSRLFMAVCWPNPLFWIVSVRLRAVSETLSDESVLAAGADPRAYAECLLNHHQRARKHAPSVAFSTVGRKSSLSQRIEGIMTAKNRVSQVVSVRARVAIVFSAIVLGGLSAIVFGKPGPLPPSQSDDQWELDPYDAEVIVISRDRAMIKDAWLVNQYGTQTAALKAEHGPSTVSVKPSGSKPDQASLIVFLSNGDLAYGKLWPRRKRLERIEAMPTRTAEFQAVGLVSDPTGALVGVGALFSANLKTGEQEEVPIPDQLTTKFSGALDRNGRFRIKGLPIGSGARLVSNDDRYTIADQERTVPAEALGRNPSEVPLLPASSISGKVLSGGKAAPGVLVVAQIQSTSIRQNVSSWGQTVSAADGSFTIPKLSGGKYNVTPILNSGMEKGIAVRAVEGVVVQTARAVNGVNVSLEPSTTITGTVQDEHGKPLPHVSVGLYGPSRPESSAMIQGARTDENGVYTLYVPTGRHRVYVSDSRWGAASKQVDTTVGKPAVVDLVVKTRVQDEVMVGRQPSETELKEMKEREVIEEKEMEPTPAAMSFGPGGPFYGPVKLKSGVTIKLEFMQCIVDGRDRIWQPDGSAPTAAHKKAALPLGFKSDGSDVRRMLGYISFDKKLNEFPTAIVQVPQPSSWNVYQSYGVQNDNRSINMASFRANKTLRQTDMKFGVATGPWKVIGSCTFPNNRKNPSTVRIASMSSSKNALSISVWVDSKWSSCDVQMRAYNSKGKPYQLESYTPLTLDRKYGQLEGSFTFGGDFANGYDPKMFDRLELIARPYEWVTFKGIHLYPN